MDAAEISLLINTKSQKLEVLRNGNPISDYDISTSKFGLGFEEGSFCTPTGNFSICEKIGDDAPEGTIFRGRKPIGEVSSGGGEGDQVLTRILWLEGLDKENRNTKERYIYIHGTNQEDLIGTAASHGCIRMRNSEVIDLFKVVPVGCSVKIS